MEKILILSNEQTFTNKINNVIDKQAYTPIHMELKPNDAYNYLYNNMIQLCIIHTSYIANSYIMIDKLLQTRKTIVIYFSSKMEIGYLSGILNNPRFYLGSDKRIEGVNDIIALLKRDSLAIDKLIMDNYLLHEKLDEAELVKKAKLLLMKNKDMNENDAYKYILKIAMDERISKTAIAKRIIDSLK